MLVFGGKLADLMGLKSPLLLQIIGIGLLLFAAELVYQISKKRLSSLRALVASLADLGWVSMSLILLLFLPEALTASGTVIVALVAAVVLLCAVLQLSGIEKMHRLPGRDAYRHCVPMEVGASAESLWRIIGDLGSIAQYAPQLASSRLVNGEISGVGSVRCCQDVNGKQWSERCTAYESGHRLELTFLCDEPGFPLPVKEMVGGWELKELGENCCEVRVWWELVPKVKLLALLIMPTFSHMTDRDFEGVMNNIAGKVGTANARGLARLLPMPC